jgi:hypothetical protein
MKTTAYPFLSFIAAKFAPPDFNLRWRKFFIKSAQVLLTS